MRRALKRFQQHGIPQHEAELAAYHGLLLSVTQSTMSTMPTTWPSSGFTSSKSNGCGNFVRCFFLALLAIFLASLAFASITLRLENKPAWIKMRPRKFVFQDLFSMSFPPSRIQDHHGVRMLRQLHPVRSTRGLTALFGHLRFASIWLWPPRFYRRLARPAGQLDRENSILAKPQHIVVAAPAHAKCCIRDCAKLRPNLPSALVILHQMALDFKESVLKLRLGHSGGCFRCERKVAALRWQKQSVSPLVLLVCQRHVAAGLTAPQKECCTSGIFLAMAC
jgi:hypothetical protein